jgi:DNA invertase Pin-like site-specific DNA recombinase
MYLLFGWGRGFSPASFKEIKMENTELNELENAEPSQMSKPIGKRSYIYTRVSTTKQDTQVQVNQLISRYPGSTIVEEIQSGTKARPKLEKLIKSMYPGDQLVVWKFDRLSRSVVDLCRLIEIFIEKKIHFVSEYDGLDLGTSSGRLQARIMAVLAGYERELISERTKAGLALAKERGSKIGGVIGNKGKRGYRKWRSPIMLKMIFDLKAEGKSWLEIAQALKYENTEWDLGPQTVYLIHKRHRDRLDPRPARILFDKV